MMQTFDIFSKINIVSALFYSRVLTITTRVETIQLNNNVMDVVSIRTEAKRITQGQCKVLPSCQLLDNTKKLTSCQKFRCKFSYLQTYMNFFRNFEYLIQENVSYFCERLRVTAPGSVLHMYLSVPHTVS